MWTRRAFLQISGGVGSAALAARFNGVPEVAAASAAVADRTPEDVAQDEFYWREIQQAFTLDRTLINLNNGNSCPSPRVVHEAYKRYLDSSNQLPVHYRGMIERNIETVRRRLAAEFGCDLEEMAITRNASEALQIAQCGLDLKPGDEILTTDQDYPRMLTTWDQRVRRDKIKLTRINFPVPTTAQDLVQRFERAITPQTKVLHFCHITNLSGQVFPVQQLGRMARQRGILTIVDGAHAVAHFPFKLRDLDVDFYGTSLHKWLLAPHGTGFLYVRRENIPKLWPLQAVGERQVADIRKFEAIGTHPAGARAAIAEALAFHQAIGADRKAARLRYLTTRWANALKANPRIRILSNLGEPKQTWGLAMVGIDGVDARDLSTFMFDKYRIIINAVVREKAPEQTVAYNGLRVTPNVYSTLEEIDTFVMAMEDAMKNGVKPAPSTARRG
jgi:selenocysteine lyase/cysteine desulfurase